MSRAGWKLVVVVLVVFALSSCRSRPGPDKTVAGAVLGAGWGAGAGAVIGNQTNNTGPGAAVGAGFGAVSGLMSGATVDVLEEQEIEQSREMEGLKVQITSNQRRMAMLQRNLDQRDTKLHSTSIGARVYFGPSEAALSTGAIDRLQRLTNSIKLNPYVHTVEIHGHTDDMGDAAKNHSLSEARAQVVADFIASHGVSSDRVRTIAHGADKPLASNAEESGRQLNRRAEVVVLK